MPVPNGDTYPPMTRYTCKDRGRAERTLMQYRIISYAEASAITPMSLSQWSISAF